MKEIPKKYLEADIPLHIGILEPLRLGKAELLAAEEHGVLILLEDGRYMLSADSLKAAEDMLSPILGKIQQIVVCREGLTRALCEKYGWVVDCPCVQAVYDKKEPLPLECDIRPLGMEYFDTVLQHYSLFQDPQYVEDRINSGVIFGAFVEGGLAGFIGEHQSGSMGMLEIFPEFRRRGLTVQLESYQINRYLAQGRVPYDQVVLGNDKSMGLQRKLGMTFSRDTVNWLKVEG